MIRGKKRSSSHVELYASHPTIAPRLYSCIPNQRSTIGTSMFIDAIIPNAQPLPKQHKILFSDLEVLY